MAVPLAAMETQRVAVLMAERAAGPAKGPWRHPGPGDAGAVGITWSAGLTCDLLPDICLVTASGYSRWRVVIGRTGEWGKCQAR
jgi:hypothetical protein